jgi:hypothetical protein
LSAPLSGSIVELVATERALARCGERIAKLSDSHLDSESLRREAIAELQHIVGFDRWCAPLADPQTLIPHSGLAELDFGPAVPRLLELEYSCDDYAAKHVVARRVNTAGSLIAEAGGDLARSQRWDEVMRPAGIGDVMSVACRDALGCWAGSRRIAAATTDRSSSRSSTCSRRSRRGSATRFGAGRCTRATSPCSSRLHPG